MQGILNRIKFVFFFIHTNNIRVKRIATAALVIGRVRDGFESRPKTMDVKWVLTAAKTKIGAQLINMLNKDFRTKVVQSKNLLSKDVGSKNHTQDKIRSDMHQNNTL